VDSFLNVCLRIKLFSQILIGSEEGFQEAKSQIGSWYEYLCMLLNYQYPLLRPASLRAFAAKGIDDYGDFSIVLTPLDKVLLAAMDYDIVTVRLRSKLLDSTRMLRLVLRKVIVIHAI